jgi:hypothetical protein
MHWTSLFERRFFPPDAMVIDDLACVGCGYNLRGIRVRGRCPECGQDIGDSLFVITQPDETGAAFRQVAGSFLFLLALYGGCFLLFGAGWLLFGGLILLGGAGFRLLGARTLRFQCGFGRLPLVGARVRRFWIMCLVDVGFGLLTILGAVGAQVMTSTATPNPWVVAGVSAAIAWQLVTIAVALTALSFGRAVAQMTEYERLDREGRRAMWSWLAIPLVVLIAVFAHRLAVAFLGNQPAQVVVSGLALLAVLGSIGIAILLTWISLMHLAVASERERAPRDDVVDRDREAIAPYLREPAEELPPIEYEG